MLDKLLDASDNEARKKQRAALEQQPKPATPEPKPVNKKPDDLKEIEGIGPKIAELLTNAGIASYAQLTGTEMSRLKEVLAAGGNRFATADPSSWPAQAKLAAEGRSDELTALQKKLRGGR